MSGVTIVTARTTDPVSSNEIKLALRIPTSDTTHDDLIDDVMEVAIDTVQNYLQRTFTQETLKLSLDAIPYQDDMLPEVEGLTTGPYLTRVARSVSLPRPPLLYINSVKTYADDDTATTMASSTYYVDTASEMGRVVLRTGSTWGDMLRVANALEVIYVAGYGTAATDVPKPIRQAITSLAVNYFENPEVQIKGESSTIVSGILQSNLRPYRVSRFGIGYN